MQFSKFEFSITYVIVDTHALKYKNLFNWNDIEKYIVLFRGLCL